MDCRIFYEKYLADIRDAQLGNGVIPAVSPLPTVGSYAYTGHDAAAGWCEAIGEIPYTHYRMYGDKKIVRDNLPTLCDIGHSDIAYHLITNREYPGWGYSVVNGATTIWEHWDSYTESDGIKKGNEFIQSLFLWLVY